MVIDWRGAWRIRRDREKSIITLISRQNDKKNYGSTLERNIKARRGSWLRENSLNSFMLSLRKLKNTLMRRGWSLVFWLEFGYLVI